MIIRQATASDAAALAALSTQLGYPTQPGEAAERLRTLGERPDHAVLVAEEEGAVLGWVHVCGMFFLESPPFAEVAGLVVDERRPSRSSATMIGRPVLEPRTAWPMRGVFMLYFS